MRVAIELPGTCVSHQRVEIVDHVVRNEGVAVAPGDALAQVQHVFRRVLVDLPGLQQPGLEGEVGQVAHHRLAEQPSQVGLLRPVEQPWILDAHHRHRDPQRPAGLACGLGQRRRGAQAQHPVGRRRGQAQRRGQRQELAAVEPSGARLRRQRGCGRMGRLAVDRRVRHRLSAVWDLRAHSRTKRRGGQRPAPNGLVTGAENIPRWTAGTGTWHIWIGRTNIG